MRTLMALVASRMFLCLSAVVAIWHRATLTCAAQPAA